MELYQLRCFCEAAVAQNFTKAAQKLHVSQPALSKTISRLEEDLGVSLFDRRSKSVILNEYGQAVLAKAEDVFASMEDMRLSVEDIRKGSVGLIKIGSTLPSSENSWLLTCIRDFLLANPKVQIIQRQMSPEALRRAVLESEVEIALGGEFLMDPELDWTELFTRRLGLLVSESSPFADRDGVSVAELAGETFLCNTSNADMEDLTRAVCGRAGFEPHIAVSANYSNLIGELVSLGRGMSFVPEQVYQENNAAPYYAWEKGIRMVPLREAYCVQRGIAAVSRGRYVPNAARLLYRKLVARASA